MDGINWNEKVCYETRLKNNESNWEGLEWNVMQRGNTLWNLMVGNESDWTERNWMDQKLTILIWSMMGDYESYCDGLEQNLLQLDNNIWNLTGVEK